MFFYVFKVDKGDPVLDKMGNIESVDGQSEMKHHIMPLKVPMPDPTELEEKFAIVLVSFKPNCMSEGLGHSSHILPGDLCCVKTASQTNFIQSHNNNGITNISDANAANN